MNFDSFAGNEAVKERLKNLLSAGMMPHAVLFEGEEGTGKRTAAAIVSAALMCTSEEDNKPCGQCAACKKVFSGSHPDVKLVSPAGAGKQIPVDAVRAARSDMFVLPNEARVKVCIIEQAQLLNEQAQNALLKILEEPPSYAVFMLTCDDRHSLLPTILSRCAVFRLDGVEEELAVQVVRERLPEAQEQDIRSAAGVWGGVIGKMLDGLQSGELMRSTQTAAEVASAAVKLNEADLMFAVAPLEKDRSALKTVLTLLRLICRDALILLSDGGKCISGCQKEAQLFSETLTTAQLFAIIKLIDEIHAAALRNVNGALLVTRLCYGIRAAAGR